MGDRCQIHMTFRAADYNADEELRGYFEYEDWKTSAAGTVNVEEGQANGGYCEEREEWAKRYPFIGEHGPGCEYGPFVFASDGQGQYSEFPANGAGDPVVSIQGDGLPHPRELEAVQWFVQVRSAAYKALGMPEPGKEGQRP